MKKGHRLSCKHLDVILARVILAVLSHCLMRVLCVLLEGVGEWGRRVGGVNLRRETSHNLLNNN